MKLGSGPYEREQKHLKLRVLSMVVCHDGSVFPYFWSMLIRRPADFEKTFIQCIVYNFEVLKEYGDEAEVKAKGKVLTKGKDYVVEVRIEW